MDNPLLQGSKTPVDYSAITLQNMQAAFDHVLNAHEQGIARIIERQQALPTWDDLVLAVDELDAQLLAVHYAVIPLGGKHERWGEAINGLQARVGARFYQKFTNNRLQALYARLAISAHGVNLDVQQRATLRWHLEKFASSGVALGEDKKARLAELQVQIGTLQNAFRSNLDRPGLLIEDEEQLRGLPPRLREELAVRAEEAGEQGWLVACESATTEAMLRQASHRPLREQLYRAFHTRGVSTDLAQDNGTHLQQLAECLDEKARLLGAANHVELSLRSKSAGSLSEVGDFLQSLAAAVKPAMAQWRTKLQQQATAQNLGPVQPWDISYLQATAGDASTNEAFREYFPLSAVVTALTGLARQLFALELRPQPLATWDDSVQSFEVWQDHACIGLLYLDAVQHAGKQPDAVFTTYVRNRRIDAEGIYQPAVVVVNSDIPAALAGAEPLLDHLSLRKLYHEFGHALHHLLVRTTNHVMSNVTELGNDGAELCSKLLERWVWDARYLAGIAAPREDGSALSEAQAEAYLSQFKQEGIEEIGRDLSLALFDLDLHGAPHDGRTLEQRLQQARSLCGYWPLADFEHPAHAFDHLVTGYDAGFYAYLWADVHAFDLFTRFEAHGLLDRETGRALQETLFEPGASQPLRDGIEAFLGRLPSHAAYARWYGLT
ncbi:peptidase M3 [Pseudomonas sp. ITEM 17296]|uniref:M3 family metallopeptidase n=1 Tax=Pseudomonas sp. ITEM 17296 TaxID=2790281 RepID=UPI0023808587|nr:M3 family metallopeptidase [Pseudomonas sp. ITEM 17296]MDE4536822.1 peptidase M3 [Pseudomonas sp. ITEM 17296]